jgi:Glycosyl hydrolase family 71
MYRALLFAGILAVGVWAQAQLNIVPDTTLTEQTANNTSATTSFATFYQPDATSRSVSKEPTLELLYPGASTEIYAAVLPWFGKWDHINVGYSSLDPSQVASQIADMKSRGITGAILDFYGQYSYENNGILVFKQQAELQGFKFVVMIDGGAIQYQSCSGCTPTQALIEHMNYVANTYYGSPSYMRIGRRPVLFTFGLEFYDIDWGQVRAQTVGKPRMIFRNAVGYTDPISDGAFSWVAPEDVTADDPSALKYLDYFYSQSFLYTGYQTFGSGYPGFNDQLASWGSGRKIDQRCGETWLASMQRAGLYYSTGGTQLSYLQIVTWNDYEEGTAIEAGIDNCVSVSATVSPTTLSWQITGQEDTVSFYAIYISQDGENLMTLANLPVNEHSLDLTQYGLAAGTYYFYVRATGKASIKNQMSPATLLTAGG